LSTLKFDSYLKLLVKKSEWYINDQNSNILYLIVDSFNIDNGIQVCTLLKHFSFLLELLVHWLCVKS